MVRAVSRVDMQLFGVCDPYTACTKFRVNLISVAFLITTTFAGCINDYD